MPAQPDLLRLSIDDVTVEQGRRELRLWVRRVVIWDAPGSVVRDIPLTPGLNIIWSPDSGRVGEPMGHGGGKTSLCRLIRYCLGEDSFGTQAQRELIGRAFPDGYVGAEVRLDGTIWTVARPIGGARGHHHAGTDLSLDDLIAGSVPHTGVSDMRRAITAALMPDAAALMPVPIAEEHGWEAALSWLSRDQECRLRDALDWRAPETQSHSPSRALSSQDRLIIVRLLINSLRMDELRHGRRAQELKTEIDRARSRRKRLFESRADLAQGLVDILGGQPSEDQGELWANLTAEAVAKAEEGYDSDVYVKLTAARTSETKLNRNLNDLQLEIGKQSATLEAAEDFNRALQSDHARAHTLHHDAANPVCEMCGRPITPDATGFIAQREEAATSLWAQFQQKVEDARRLKSSILTLRSDVALLQQQVVAAGQTVKGLEATFVEQAKRLTTAKGHATMTSLYRKYGQEVAAIDAKVEQQSLDRVGALAQADRLRAGSADAVARLSQLFDTVMTYLVPDAVDGRVIIADEGLELRLQRGGPISTSAIESLKVVAFDLAVMLMSMEGRTQLPAFLIHDSPREADLGRSIYDRLFDLTRRLEEFGPTPIFQYIVTTTTAPPDTARTDSWLKLELHSAPSDARLFKADL